MSRQTTRVDREAMKHDPFFDFTSRATAFVSANLSTVLGTVGAVVLAIVLAVFWSRSRGEKKVESDQLASIVVSSYVAGQYESSIQQAVQLQTTFGGTRGAVLADFVKGKAELQLGRFTEAEQSFRSYLEHSSKAPFYQQASEAGLAASLEGQGRFAEAAEKYAGLAVTLTDDQADEMLLSAARAYRFAGALDQARPLLQKIIDRDKVGARPARLELAVLDAVGSTKPDWYTLPTSGAVTPADTTRAAAP